MLPLQSLTYSLPYILVFILLYVVALPVTTRQGALVNTDNGIGYYDMNLLYNLWLNNPSHGDMPGTWEAFLDWFNNNSNVRVPLTDAPLFMLLLMGCYMAYAVNHKKPSKNKPS